MPDITTSAVFRQFGRDLIETGDLDPLYIGVYRAELDHIELPTFLLTYWLFYNAGFASHAAQVRRDQGQKAYWELIVDGAKDSISPRRGTERRHFRGGKAAQAAEWLAVTYGAHAYAGGGPERAVADVAAVDSGGGTTFKRVFGRAQAWPQFGPWIAFKVADMLDRCGYCPVDSVGCDLAMYDAPVKGAALYAELTGRPGYPIADVVRELTWEYRGHLAPPAYDRVIGVYEVETVLCKTKSAAGGHYHIGKDTIEIRHMLAAEHSDVARRILAAMPSTDQLELLYT